MQDDWLSSIPWLDNKERATLRKHRYNHPDAVAGETGSAIAAATGLPAGLCARLVRHGQQSAAPPRAEDGLELGEARQHLKGLGGPQHAMHAQKLRALGIGRVVVDAEGHLDEALLRDFLDDNAPEVDWFGAGQVVPVELVGRRRLHHPRTGAALSRGDVIQWVKLGRDRLIVAAAIFDTPDVLAGASDREVHADVEAGGAMTAAITPRLARSAAMRARAEALVDGGSRRPPTDAATPWRTPNDLSDLFVQLFDAQELRHFVARIHPELVPNLPGGGTHAHLASETVSLLRRCGYLTEDLRLELVRTRPARAGEIAAAWGRFA